jgi:hypothetical protein
MRDEKELANQIRAHILNSISELSSTLVLAQAACSREEFDSFRGFAADIIARLDNLLRVSIYNQFPDLDDLKG